MIIRLRSNLIWSNVFEIVFWFYWRQQIYFVVGTSFKCVFIKNVRNIKPRNKTESAMFKAIIQTCKHWLCSTLRQPGQEKQHPHYLTDQNMAFISLCSVFYLSCIKKSNEMQRRFYLLQHINRCFPIILSSLSFVVEPLLLLFLPMVYVFFALLIFILSLFLLH